MAKKANGKFYGTGRRKSSIARVYLVPGNGNITINKRSLDEYFGLETLKVVVKQPLVLTETADKYDVIVKTLKLLASELPVHDLDLHIREALCTSVFLKVPLEAYP